MSTEDNALITAIENLQSSATVPLAEETRLLLALAKQAQQTGRMPDLSCLQDASRTDVPLCELV